VGKDGGRSIKTYKRLVLPSRAREEEGIKGEGKEKGVMRGRFERKEFFMEGKNVLIAGSRPIWKR